MDAIDNAVLLALDWGTSSLRAYLLDADGETIASRHEPWGLMQVAALTGLSGAAAYERTFEKMLDPWPTLRKDVPVIAAGMVGSAQGWMEAPYLRLPCSIDTLGRQLVPLTTRTGRTLWLVPGLREDGALPNVMRGEETQIVGALARLGRDRNASPDDDTRSILLGLPGSHSKWARLESRFEAERGGGRVTARRHLVHFDTFMTGETYTALSQHTILARTLQAGVRDDAAFARGVDTALAPASKGLLATAFSCRALGLFGELDAAQQGEFLSGLVIGEEIARMRADLLHAQDGAIARHDVRLALIGDAELCRRYTVAMSLAGVAEPIPTLANASEAGLWHLALQAGLVTARTST